MSVSPKIGGKLDLYLDILTKIKDRRGPYQVTVLPKYRPDVGLSSDSFTKIKAKRGPYPVTVLLKVLHEIAICATYDSYQIHCKVSVSANQIRAALDIFRVS